MALNLCPDSGPYAHDGLTSQSHGAQLAAPQPVRIDLYRDGLFALTDRGGKAGLLLPVFDRDGAQIDSVAWLPGQPSNWYMLRGVGTWLGEHLMRDAIFDLTQPLKIRIYETPSSWLAHGGQGACCLNWNTRGFDDSVLEPFDQVICESWQLKNRLQRTLHALSQPPYRILVAKAAHRPST